MRRLASWPIQVKPEDLMGRLANEGSTQEGRGPVHNTMYTK
jgi:hypothetical protein